MVFFNNSATTEIYTRSLHDALPISEITEVTTVVTAVAPPAASSAPVSATLSNPNQALPPFRLNAAPTDRKSTRLNSSHANISYAVFCLKKKKTTNHNHVSRKECKRI